MTKARAVRVLFYLLGLLTLAFGLTLNTKTGFGVSPIVSVAYTVSSIWELNFGNVMLAEYVVFAALEIVLHILMWRQNRMSVSRFRSILIMDLLQLPLTLLFTRFMNLFSTVLPDLTADCSFLGSVAGHRRRRCTHPRHAADCQSGRWYRPGSGRLFQRGGGPDKKLL